MIPCIGYPSRSAAVRALRAEGKTPHQIVLRTGLSAKVVDTLLTTEFAGIRELFSGLPPRETRAVDRVPLDVNGVVVGVLPAAARASRTADIRRASGDRAAREHKAKTLPRYLLRQGDQFLHMSGQGLTSSRQHAWMGFKANLPAIRKLNPAAEQMTPVEVPPPSRGEYRPTLR